MFTIPLNDVLDKLPAAELEQTLAAFVAPMVERLPDQRLKRIVPTAVRGILTSETAIITAMARTTSRIESDTWPAAKHLYRFVGNDWMSKTCELEPWNACAASSPWSCWRRSSSSTSCTPGRPALSFGSVGSVASWA